MDTTYSPSFEQGDKRHCGDWRVRRVIAPKCAQSEIQKDRLVAVGQLITGMLHDIKNHVSGLNGLYLVTKRRFSAGDDAEAKRYFEKLEGPIACIKNLCANILDFATCKNQTVERVRVVLVVNSVMDMVIPSMGTARSLVQNYCGDVAVSANTFQVEQVLLNLTQNAVQAIASMGSTDSGEVQIIIHPMRRKTDASILEVESTGSYVGITVSDNGPGMSEEVLEKVATPFFTTKLTGGGTGLGLFMSAHLAELYGGTLIVKTKEGEGTRITLCLPFVP